MILKKKWGTRLASDLYTSGKPQTRSLLCKALRDWSRRSEEMVREILMPSALPIIMAQVVGTNEGCVIGIVPFKPVNLTWQVGAG